MPACPFTILLVLLLLGERLHITRNTVKTQALSVYRKLGASSRSEAVNRASQLGLQVLQVHRSRAKSDFIPYG